MSDDAVKYLLGQLSEEDRERIERAFFSSGAEFEAILAAEDELFFDYAAGALSPEERAAFEQRCLCSGEGRRRLAAAEAIVRACRPPAGAARPATADRSRERSLALTALAIAASLLAAVSVWLARDLGRARADLATVRADMARYSAAAQSGAPATSPPLVIAVALAPGLTRAAGERRRVRVPGDAGSVKLDLNLGAATLGAGRRLVVRTADGDEIWSEALAGAAGARAISAQVPARLLATADYEIVVTGTANQRPLTYSFTVVRP